MLCVRARWAAGGGGTASGSAKAARAAGGSRAGQRASGAPHARAGNSRPYRAALQHFWRHVGGRATQRVGLAISSAVLQQGQGAGRESQRWLHLQILDECLSENSICSALTFE